MGLIKKDTNKFLLNQEVTRLRREIKELENKNRELMKEISKLVTEQVYANSETKNKKDLTNAG